MIGRASTARVARPGPPSFIAAAVSAALLSAVLLSSDAHAAATSGYRLAGVIAVGKDYLGFLELPGGGQVLVREGSTVVGGGRVVALNRETLKIAFPGRTLDLSLDGTGLPSATAATLGVLKGQTDLDNVMVRNVDNGELRDALSTQKDSGKRTDPASEVGRRFASVINIPVNARVTAINEQPVTSAATAMALVDRSLANGIALRLNLAGSNGDPETRVYLSPVMR
jgi:hypothetical protein